MWGLEAAQSGLLSSGRPAARVQCFASKHKQQRNAGAKQSGTRAEEAAAILRRLRRQPLVLTTHARERLRNRQLSQQDIEHVLHHGVLNWKLSKFGGKPSPVYVLEGPGLPSSAAAAAAAAAAADSAAAAEVTAGSAAPSKLGRLMPPACERDDAEAEHVSSAAAGAATDAAAAAAGAPAAGAGGPAGGHAAPATAAAAAEAASEEVAATRQLRVPFAANDGASVVLTVVDLQLDGGAG